MFEYFFSLNKNTASAKKLDIVRCIRVLFLKIPVEFFIRLGDDIFISFNICLTFLLSHEVIFTFYLRHTMLSSVIKLLHIYPSFLLHFIDLFLSLKAMVGFNGHTTSPNCLEQFFSKLARPL